MTAPKPKAVRVPGPIPDPGKAPETTGRIFLLSPADSSGPRAVLLHRPESDHDLARRLRGADAALGDVFTFVSP